MTIAMCDAWVSGGTAPPAPHASPAPYPCDFFRIFGGFSRRKPGQASTGMPAPRPEPVVFRLFLQAVSGGQLLSRRHRADLGRDRILRRRGRAARRRPSGTATPTPTATGWIRRARLPPRHMLRARCTLPGLSHQPGRGLRGMHGQRWQHAHIPPPPARLSASSAALARSPHRAAASGG